MGKKQFSAKFHLRIDRGMHIMLSTGGRWNKGNYAVHATHRNRDMLKHIRGACREKVIDDDFIVAEKVCTTCLCCILFTISKSCCDQQLCNPESECLFCFLLGMAGFFLTYSQTDSCPEQGSPAVSGGQNAFILASWISLFSFRNFEWFSERREKRDSQWTCSPDAVGKCVRSRPEKVSVCNHKWNSLCWPAEQKHPGSFFMKRLH